MGTSWGSLVVTSSQIKNARPAKKDQATFLEPVGPLKPSTKVATPLATQSGSSSVSNKLSDAPPATSPETVLVYNLPELPKLQLPVGLDEVTAESVTEYCNHIQTLLSKLKSKMQVLGNNTRHTWATKEAITAIQELCPEIEAAIITYLTELDKLELKVSAVDPIFDFELEDMGQDNPYLETLELQAQNPVYGFKEPPPLLSVN
ncbi:hypothetical protein FRX31_023684, partial [Thalictrum thalictroides]